MTCAHCGKAAWFITYRPKNLVSLLEEIRVARGYCHCAHCGQGQFPWDQTLRISPQRLTPDAPEVVCLAGIGESFGKAAERTLVKLAGLRLSESTVESTTEAAGRRLGERLHEGERFGALLVGKFLAERIVLAPSSPGPRLVRFPFLTFHPGQRPTYRRRFAQ